MVLVGLHFVESSWQKELKSLENRKIELSEQDLHIIDIYSKKNPAVTMPQFGNPDFGFLNHATDITRMKNVKADDYIE